MMKTLEAKVVDATHLELSRPITESAGRRVEVRLSDPLSDPTPEERAVQGRRIREREDAWCRTHPEALRGHTGQWVVVEGEAIVAHGSDPARLVSEARQRGIRSPYVFFVEESDSDFVRLGL